VPRADITRSITVAAPPEVVFEAVTTGSAGWLWPVDVEPRVGGAAGPGVVTVWDPPSRWANRMEQGDWWNELEHVIDELDGATRLRYRHSSVFADDGQLDGAETHTDFYLHTLAEYVAWFPGRPATWISAEAPATSREPGSFDRVVEALGLTAGHEVGDALVIDLPGVGAVMSGIDWRSGSFLGLRTADALYRVFGRERWGGGVAVTVHHFADDVDAAAVAAAWEQRLREVFA